MPDEQAAPNAPKTQTVIPVSDDLKASQQTESQSPPTGSPAAEPAVPSVAPEIPIAAGEPISPEPQVTNNSTVNSQTPKPTPPASPAASEPSSLANPNGLTPEQQKYIHHWAFGPYLNAGYFWAMDAWKIGVIFLIIETVGFYFSYFIISIAVGYLFKSLNLFGGTGASFFLITFGTGAIATLIWILGATIWAMRKGRAIAWNHRKWINFENFVEVQKKWDLAGKVFIVLTLIWIGFILIVSLPGLLLLSTNPATRIAQMGDSNTKLTTQRVAVAMEACFTANNGTYTPCSTVSKLQVQNYLSSATSSNDNEAMIDVSQDGKTAIVMAQASSSAICDTGSGSQKYYVYRSTTGKTQVECGSAMPMISNTSMPDMNMSTSPTPTSMGSMMY